MSTTRLIETAEGSNRAAFAPADWALVATAGTIWGASFFFIAVGLNSFTPPAITALRLVFGCLALGCLPAARRSVPRDDWTRIALLAVCWMAVPLSLFPFAEQRVSSSLTGMLNGSTPIFAAAVATLLLRRLPGRAQLLGIAIGVVGVVLIGLPALGEGASSAIGVALILAALCCYGLAINLAVPLQQRHGALPVLWRAQLVAVALTLPIGVLGWGDSKIEPAPFAAVLALGVLGTGLAYVATATLAGRVGGTRGSVVTYVIPVVSILLGAIVLDEEVHPLSLAGTAIVLGAAWLISRAD